MTKHVLRIAALSALAFLFAATSKAQQPNRVDVLIGFDRVPGVEHRAQVERAGGVVRFSYHLVPAIAANVPEAALAGILRSPHVTTIERDVEIQAFDHAAELTYAWGVGGIGAGAVHHAGEMGFGVHVAVIDTGIDCGHPDLVGLCGEGWDFVNGDNDPYDDDSHGTHVAGTIAALRNFAGVVGVAPQATLHALKVLDAEGNGSFSSVIAALQWSVDHGYHLTNNSYGSSINPGSIVQAAFDNANAAGVLNIAAAGNSGNCRGRRNTVGFPAEYDSVAAVAASDSNDRRPCWSSTGPTVELTGPGVVIPSTVPGNGYASYSGTSMATPHVVGVAALVIGAGVTGPANVRQVLINTALDLGTAGRDTWYGYGLVQAWDAYNAAFAPPAAATPPAVAITNPANNATVAGTVTLRAQAFDDIGVTGVNFKADATSIGPGVFVSGTAIDGYWELAWNTTSATNDTHNLTAEATDGAPQVATSPAITVTVDNTAPVPAGTVHVATLEGTATIRKRGRKWSATAIATIFDGTVPFADGATVFGYWNTNGILQYCTTNGAGQCSINSANINRKTANATFFVTDVTEPGYIYDPTLNAASAVTVNSPL